jgi:hypothetical protein
MAQKPIDSLGFAVPGPPPGPLGPPGRRSAQPR